MVKDKSSLLLLRGNGAVSLMLLRHWVCLRVPIVKHALALHLLWFVRENDLSIDSTFVVNQVFYENGSVCRLKDVSSDSNIFANSEEWDLLVVGAALGGKVYDLLRELVLDLVDAQELVAVVQDDDDQSAVASLVAQVH
jgi:hypothetical protein